MRDLTKIASATLAALTFFSGIIAAFMLLNAETTDAVTRSMMDKAAIGVVVGAFIQTTVLATLSITLETVMETNALLVDELTRAARERAKHEAALQSEEAKRVAAKRAAQVAAQRNG